VLFSGLIPSYVAAQGFTPEEALKRMKVAEGFQVKLVASEPMIRQPVTMSFDDRGRMWVIQYLQYPNPAGLKAVKVDEFLRTVYDRVPEPPPKGPKGADRITILSDPDANGRYRKAKDFVTGLNLASGMAIGHGGVFVAQSPYLLFYPDRNGDDVPDGDLQVLLKGFGMEDAHAFPNSLQWGPDGWLYGAQGSTVTAKIRGIEFQQGIWRYHPITKEFELFAEGGGNTWGVDFDRHGNLIAGTNWGGVAMLHQVQGGYYVKGFGKHGPLHNPHTYGYIEHIPCKNFKGGHVTCGGVLYYGGGFPKEYDGRYIAGNLLSNALYWYELDRKGSSFTSRQGGDFLVANDTWFRPVDCLTGPDGALYVADWYDKRATHLDPVDNWDRSNGRIYRILPSGGRKPPEKASGGLRPPLGERPLGKRSSKDVVALLSHPNDWYPREARRILAERRDRSVIPGLRKAVLEEKGQLALESLWALYVSGGFDDAFALKLFHHKNQDVRTWTIRLLGDAKKVTPAIEEALVNVARTDKSPTVRSQLACSAKRLPAKDCLLIIRALLKRDEDINDPHLPLLLWWAIEDKAISDRERVLELLDSQAAWKRPIIQATIIERLGRRYMAEGTEADYAACARLLAKAPGDAEVNLLVHGMEKALEGRRLKQVPAALEKPLANLWKKSSANMTVVRFALLVGSAEAYERATKLAQDAKTPESERLGFIEVLSQTGKSECVPLLLRIFGESKKESLRSAVLSALQPFADPRISAAVLADYPKLSPNLRGGAQTLLCSRPASTLELLKAVDAGRITAKEVPLDQVRRIAQYKDDKIRRLVEKHWGKVGPAAAGEKVARIRHINAELSRGRGDLAAGKLLYQKHCATCHTLFGEGNNIGPDLTGADRKNRDFLVTNIVDPSAVIRPEYLAYQIVTKDGRSLAGIVIESTPSALTLVNEKNERTVIARDQIEAMEASPVSLMPEKILDELSYQQIRDLFSYLQSDAPQKSPVKKGGKLLKVCLVSGSLEYDSDASLSAFQKYLEENYNVQCSRAFRKADDDLPGLDNLDKCDVMLLFTRRLTIKGKQLEQVQKYCKSGKPIVAVRTASHAFQNWPQLDKQILGGNYKGHYGSGPAAKVAIVDKAKKHPILAGVKQFESAGSLYKNTGLAKDVEVLLTGSIPDHTEPVAWTRQFKGGRIFYTSLGHQKDFKNEYFRHLLVNALYWTTKREPPK
jgi:putative membrane-bound dehydrogenase-like protein